MREGRGCDPDPIVTLGGGRDFGGDEAVDEHAEAE